MAGKIPHECTTIADMRPSSQIPEKLTHTLPLQSKHVFLLTLHFNFRDILSPDCSSTGSGTQARQL